MNNELSVLSIRDLYKLDNIVRYNTLNKVKNESVASHSFYVALFSMMICKSMGLTEEITSKAISLALVHDIPEIEINDVTHDAKQRMPEIVSILREYEAKFLLCTFPEVYDIMKSTNISDQIANQVVEVADALSVYQFCDNEVQTGNRYFIELLDQTRDRVRKEIEKTERMTNKCLRIVI